MALFTASSSAVEVNGETVLSIVAGMGAFKQRALDILATNGIESPQRGKWYKQQSWLNAFKNISQSIGSSTLTQIGKSIPASANWPPAIDNIEKALASIDVAYHQNHRGGNIGNYKYTKTGERTAKIVCDNPYPCEFDMGLITAVATKFKPAGTVAPVITHDTTQPCRKKGGSSCTYLIKW